MDFERLESELEFANHSGNSLNITEQTKLSLSVMTLNVNEKFDKVHFWGRICGLDKDYYIIVGIRFKDRINFPERQYFWCYDNFFLSPLKEVCPETSCFLQQFNGYFSGQHDMVLRAQSFDSSSLNNATLKNGKVSTNVNNEAIIARGNSTKPITELDR